MRVRLRGSRHETLPCFGGMENLPEDAFGFEGGQRRADVGIDVADNSVSVLHGLSERRRVEEAILLEPLDQRRCLGDPGVFATAAKPAKKSCMNTAIVWATWGCPFRPWRISLACLSL